MEQIKNYGFKLPIITPDNWRFGSALPFTENEVLRSEGQYDDMLPLYEPQAEKYETWGCTIWGGQNQCETYFKTKFGFEPNFLEQFNYILAGVQEGGTDPQNAYESFRNDSMVNKVFPFPRTFAEFRDKNNLTPEMYKLAKDFFDNWKIQHEWIIPSDKSKMKEAIKSLLRFGPIGLSVTAWIQKDGLYIDNGLANNHWCVCYGYIEDARGLILKIFDSYDHSTKLLSPDHNVFCAKRILITPKLTPEKMTIIQKILSAITSVLQKMSLLISQNPSIVSVAEPTPEPLPFIPKKTKGQMLYETAKDCLGQKLVSDEKMALGCVVALSKVFWLAFSKQLGENESTYKLLKLIEKDQRFSEVFSPIAGDIIISATGTGNGEVAHGHTGVVANFGILSNDSNTGIWKETWTLVTWRKYYQQNGGMMMRFFRLKD